MLAAAAVASSAGVLAGLQPAERLRLDGLAEVGTAGGEQRGAERSAGPAAPASCGPPRACRGPASRRNTVPERRTEVRHDRARAVICISEDMALTLVRAVLAARRAALRGRR